jgi:hypothetical protein
MSQPLYIANQPSVDWTAQNPILPQFTLGRESDTGKSKLGDGRTAWADLSYENPSGAGAVPVKATGAEVNTGSNDAKFVTPKALEDSDYAKTSDIPASPFDNSDPDYVSTDKDLVANYLYAAGNSIRTGDPDTTWKEVASTSNDKLFLGGDGINTINTTLGLLPATDPGEAGQWWNDNGTLKISLGA